ncbi:MAG: hypothetical protein U5R06_06045 [candidate division KSB1 bacterium]|nr:hypothetical protein [candidate division KSB1 bacterium]
MAKEITERTLSQYDKDEIALQEVLEAVTREKDTEMNFLDAYLGYRRSLFKLMTSTYYDYENNIKLLEKYNTDS